MNWLGLLLGVAAIIFFTWVILAARKEGERMNWKNPKKKLY